MNSAINLLRPVDKRLHEKKKKILLIQTGTFVLLGIVGITSLLLFFLKNQISQSVQNEEKLVNSRLNVLSDKTVKFSIVNERLQNIGIILKTRTDIVEEINLITNTLSSDIKIDSLNLDKKSIKITASSRSLIALDAYFSKMSTLFADTKTVGSVILDSFNTDANNMYSVTIEILLI